MTPPEMRVLLEEVAADLDRVDSWEAVPLPPDAPPTATAYSGGSRGWRFLVCGFSLEDQGLPPGTRGSAGTATAIDRGLVLALPRELSDKACRAAEMAIERERTTQERHAVLARRFPKDEGHGRR